MVMKKKIAKKPTKVTRKTPKTGAPKIAKKRATKKKGTI